MVDNLLAAFYADPAAKRAYELLSQAGGTVYIVGGAVRDAALGRKPKDVDLMVTGLEDDAIVNALKNSGRLDLTGKTFGVYRFRADGSEVEIALPRTEQSTGELHTDFEVMTDPHLSVEDDLARRDFTGNAMAFNIDDRGLIDPFGGKEDLQNGQLKLVNEQAFQDDPLRMVRALVANSRFGLEPDDWTKQQMAGQRDSIDRLSRERIQMELDKLLQGPNPAGALRLADETGVLDKMLAPVASAMGFDQMNPHHDLDVGTHLLAVLEAMTALTHDPDLRLAALLHDIGKPESFWRDESAPEGGGGHFYKTVTDDGTEIGKDHEEHGAQMAEALMRELKYPNERITRVVSLIRNHMFKYFNTAKGARKFLASVNGDAKMAYDLFTLRMADASGKSDGQMTDFDRENIQRGLELLQQAIEQEEAVTRKDLAITGKDVLDLGVPAGPIIGQILDRLLEVVIENPELNSREELLPLAEGLAYDKAQA